jgi:hypothetical protein
MGQTVVAKLARSSKRPASLCKGKEPETREGYLLSAYLGQLVQLAVTMTMEN